MKKILAGLLACLLLSGCAFGSGGYMPTGDALHQDTTTLPRQEENLSTEQQLTLSYDPTGTLNPYTDSDPSNRVLFNLLYQGLFAVDMDYQVTPILCKTYSVSKNMETYTFYLENATFSDGTPFTFYNSFRICAILFPIIRTGNKQGFLHRHNTAATRITY